jgi:general secretion pathway protein G
MSIPRQAASGFTLLEIMIVVSIIVVLLGLAITKMGDPTGFAKGTAVKADIQAIGTQLKLYEAMNGALPTTEEGLRALVTRPPSATRWYQLFKEVPKDPWGKEYNYRCSGGSSYELYSSGPNRIDESGGGDDDKGQ